MPTETLVTRESSAASPSSQTFPKAASQVISYDVSAKTADTRKLEPRFTSPAQRGLWLLLNKAFLPPDFDQETFDRLWETWEEPLRGQAERATPAERRRLAFARYGLTERPPEMLFGQTPHKDDQPLPLQYVVSQDGQWSMNCLACHQGTVAGQVIPGAPNNAYNMQTLYEDVRNTKLKLGKKLSHMDLGSAFVPLSTSRGTTNAVMFGVVLLNYRQPDLTVDKLRPRPALTNHDHDPPAWWQLHRKSHLYIDGFAPKGHRALMQFLLVEQNGPAQFTQWERDFMDVLAWLESLRPPKYPQAIDPVLATSGEKLFTQHCAKCHGTYGQNPQWPAREVPQKVVGTDPTRLLGLTAGQRAHYASSWFAEFKHSSPVSSPPVTTFGGAARALSGRPPAANVTVNLTKTEPHGYIAPPLDGVWASAPYFHNGSVPTLWQVLTPDQRPAIWQRKLTTELTTPATDLSKQATPPGTPVYDWRQLGLAHEVLDSVPPDVGPASRREFYDTTQKGKSNAGHDFAARLSEPARRALLEYLKTL
ncbi:MAG: cytochrome c [Pirellulales bacterium]|nr:cytochrome c [Pirellulales bacterium]